MKICVLTASVSRNAGGLFNSVRCLNKALAELPNSTVSILGLRDEFSDQDLPAWAPVTPEVIGLSGPRSFGWSSQLDIRLRSVDPDIVHTHGIWMYPSMAAARWRRRTQRPCLLSPRGMLDSWALRNSQWKKVLAGWLYENAHLRGAACIHALCESEAQSIRAYGLSNPICVIPNGIDLPQSVEAKSASNPPPWRGLVPQESRVLLYLGRIHRKKGLINLLKAWGNVLREGKNGANWVLAVAGWDQGGHEAELQQLAVELRIPFSQLGCQPVAPSAPPSVLFLGPQFGEQKTACYRSCDAFVLPSFSEGLPMAVLEAWAFGKPVMMTAQCNLPEGFAAGAALRIEPAVQSIATVLQDLFLAPPRSIAAIGENGRALVGDRFTWPKLAREMRSVYDWALGGGEKPNCVV